MKTNKDYLNSGVNYYLKGNLKKAAEITKEGLKFFPTDPNLLNNLAVIYQDLGLFSQALEVSRRAIYLNPQSAILRNNYGISLKKTGKNQEARKEFQKAIKLDPNLSEAFSNLGNTFLDERNISKAIVYYQKAIKLDSQNAKAHHNLGLAYQYARKLQKSIRESEKAVKLQPNYADAYGALAVSLQRMLAWDKLKGVYKTLEKLDRKALEDKRKTGRTPFFSVTYEEDPEKNLLVSRSWSEEIKSLVKPLKKELQFLSRKISFSKRLRIGFVSDGFRNFPTGYNIVGVLENFNKNLFQIYLYSYGKDDGGIIRKRIKKAVNNFIDIRSIDDTSAAQKINKDKIDILVDLKGYTQITRLQIFALKPAPLQVSWLGFPGTTGADFIDYIIADRLVIPPKDKKYYSEKVIYLPDTYRPTDNKMKIAKIKYKRSDFGLPEKGIIFSSFNGNYKIDPTIFNIWMNILKSVPESVLWLWGENEEVKKTILKETKKKGVKVKRIIFAKTLPKEKHLARIKLADIALDTKVTNGHTTTVDNLWVGIPVIALLGKHFCSRVSASCLHAVGMDNLIAKDLNEYEKIAITLARNPDKLKAIKKKLSANKLKYPLFNTPLFTKNLEEAFLKIWQNDKNGI